MGNDSTTAQKPLRGIRVLFLDDEADIRKTVQLHLAQQGALVETAADGREGLQILLQRDYDVLVVDLRMPNMDGPAFVREVRRIWPWLGVVIVSGFLAVGDEIPEKMKELGVVHALPKPIDFKALSEAVFLEGAAKLERVRVPDIRPLDRIQRQLALLRQFSETAFAAASLNESFRALSEGVGLLIPCSVVGIFNVGEDENLIFLNSILPVAPAFLKAVEEDMHKRFEALSGKDLPSTSLDIMHEGQPADDSAPATVSNSFCIPLIVHGEVQGLMTLADAYSESFSRDDISFLYHASAQLSTVLVGLNRMRQFAVRDVLTGLYNRRGLEEQLAWIWNMSQRTSEPVSIMVLDVDHFKTLNDTYGHLVGDAVLREFAQLVQSSVRAADVAARYGGDEIVIVLPNLNEADSRIFSERLLSSIREHVFCPGAHDLKLTASAGLACLESPACGGPDSSTLLKRADQTLYAAKRSGRNKACMWSDVTLKVPTVAEHVSFADFETEHRPPQGHVLVVDDDPTVQKLLLRYLERDHFRVQIEATVQGALNAMEKPNSGFDIVITDLVLTGESGLDVLDRLREKDQDIIPIVITGHATAENAIACLRRGAYDLIQKPFVPEQLSLVMERAMEYRQLRIENRRYQTHLEEMVKDKSAALARSLDEISKSYDFTLEALAAMLDAREHQTGQHSLRVARLSRILAAEMGLSRREIDEIGHGALLHDIGKIAIPDNILLKPGPLSEDEWKTMKTHAEVGYAILRSSTFLGSASEIVFAHQERFDGSGYPRGLKGEEIPLGARIFAVVDTYDAMRSIRTYSSASSPDETMAEILQHRGKLFDPAVVDALVRCQAQIEAIGQWDARSASPGQGGSPVAV